MRRGGVEVGVLRVIMGKVYARVVVWRVAFGALSFRSGGLVTEDSGVDAVMPSDYRWSNCFVNHVCHLRRTNVCSSRGVS